MSGASRLVIILPFPKEDKKLCSQDVFSEGNRSSVHTSMQVHEDVGAMKIYRYRPYLLSVHFGLRIFEISSYVNKRRLLSHAYEGIDTSASAQTSFQLTSVMYSPVASKLARLRARSSSRRSCGKIMDVEG